MEILFQQMLFFYSIFVVIIHYINSIWNVLRLSKKQTFDAIRLKMTS